MPFDSRLAERVSVVAKLVREEALQTALAKRALQAYYAGCVQRAGCAEALISPRRAPLCEHGDG